MVLHKPALYACLYRRHLRQQIPRPTPFPPLLTTLQSALSRGKSNNTKADATSIKPSDSFTGVLQACSYTDGSGERVMIVTCVVILTKIGIIWVAYADQTVVATLSHDTSLGVLGMELRRSTTTTGNSASTIEINPNSQSENEITVDHTESATLQSGNEYDYYVKVYAVGTEGHEAQPYQLAVDFSAACLPDANEGDFSITTSCLQP